MTESNTTTKPLADRSPGLEGIRREHEAVASALLDAAEKLNA